MPQFKCVFQFVQVNRGWTEVHYKSVADLASAAIFSQVFLSTALQFRHQLTTLVKIRVSDVLNPRSSVVITVNQSGPPFLTTPQAPEPVAVAAVTNLVSPSIGASRKLWLRGLVDSYINRDSASGADMPNPLVLQAIQNYINQISISNFVIRALTKVGGPPNNFVSIASLNGVPGTGITVLTTIGGAVIPPNTPILISQVSQKAFPGLKGVFMPSASTATTVTIPYNSPVAGPVNLPKGRYRQVLYQYGAISTVGSGFSAFNSRSTGKNQTGGRGAKRGARGLRLL